MADLHAVGSTMFTQARMMDQLLPSHPSCEDFGGRSSLDVHPELTMVRVGLVHTNDGGFFTMDIFLP